MTKSSLSAEGKNSMCINLLADICDRCVRLGLVCGGYQDFSFKPPATVPAPRRRRQLVARDISPATISDSGVELATRSVAPGSTTTCMNLSPKSISTWLSATMTPYEGPEERRGLQSWLEMMLYMGRSDIGLKYWSSIVPMLSWSYDAVRHAQTATALVLDSHRRRDDVTQYKAIELASLRHAKLAVAAVLNQQVPVEVEIVVSTILWMYDITIGRCYAGNNHAVTAYRLASQADPRGCTEPLIVKYVHSFLGELNPASFAELPESKKQDLIKGRTEYSRDILQHFKHSIQALKNSLTSEFGSQLRVYSYTRAKVLLESSEKALDDVLRGWHHPARFKCIESLDANDRFLHAKVVEKYSPFGPILQHFQTFFEDHDEHNLTLFHLAFRPYLDHFMWVAAGSGLAARQAVMPLWNVQWAISPRASIIADS